MSMMMELTPRVPINVKRRAVSAVRDFPKGCGPKAISNPTPTPTTPVEIDSKSETSTSSKVPDEGPRVSNLDGSEIRDESDEVSAQNVAKSEDLELQNGSLASIEGVKINGHADEEHCGPKRLANGVMEVDCCVWETEVFGSKTFLPPKRRKVSAVRDFPVGCGRGASKIGTKTKNLGVGSVVSSESKAFDDDTEVGPIASSKSKGFHGKRDDESKDSAVGESYERVEDEVRKSGEELIGEEVQETKGEAIVKSSKVAILSGEKKKEKKELAKLVVPPAKKLDGEVTRNESKKIKIKEANKEATAKLPKMKSLDVEMETEANEGLARVRSENEVKRNDGKKISQNVGESSSEGRVKPGGRSLEENRVKKLVIQSSSEKKLEGRDVRQAGKNLKGKEPQDARDASGIKISHKAGKSMALVPGNKDVENMKRKLPNEERDESLEAYGDKLIVQALMSAENCPWRKNKNSGGIKSRSAPPRTRAKKKIPKLLGGNSASRCMDIVVLDDDEGGNENEKALTIYNGSHEFCVTMTPSVPSKFICTGNSSEEVVDRNMVKKTLRLFQLITRKLLQKEEKSKGTLSQGKEANSKEKGSKRVDLVAAGVLKDNNHWVNHGEPIIGNVPGVEVGDEFHYRVELSIIGIHRPFQGGIDSTKRNGVLLAMSIVASGGYPDDIDSSDDVLIYSGSGGNATGTGDKQAGDQKLERGNLALKNSIDAQTPVRVVYGSKEYIYSDVRPKAISTFTYDGLYLVEKYWPERGNNGFNVFKFQLRKIPGQPEISLKELKKSRKSKVREGIVVKDISDGKESMPICAVNTVDNELPMPFKYINKAIYPKRNVPKSPKGCDCTNGCSDSEKCACAMKNGGEIPYNFNGAIVQAKILVYECGPSCKCPPSCHNRVSQHGIKLPLEIFKTKTRGWGVRSLYSIPSGTFVCEYVGEMLAEAEAEQRDNDEYLFDIGNNYDDHNLWDGLPSFVPGVASNASCENVEEGGFTIDAAKFGNIGRFINHSCSPNLYAQNVLYDHDEKKMPHVMFFAIDNIPPLQELTYHYNYTLDQVRDSEGNIKKKECFCGSHECTGRLY